MEAEENKKIYSLLPISGRCPAAPWELGPQCI